MKSLRVLFWLALLAVSASAQVRGLVVREVDGSPRGTGITEIVVSNTTLTINGQRAIITTGGGGGSGITVGTTTITSGTNTRVLYNNSGVVGEYVITGTGNVMMSASPTTTGRLTGADANFATAVTTGTGSTAGFEITANSLTTGNGHEISSSSVSSGNVVRIAATGTAAASNTKTALSVATSGANATSTQTTYGAQISNTSTGTSSTNVALNLSASGGTTNAALNVSAGQVVLPTGTLAAPAITLGASNLGFWNNGSAPIVVQNGQNAVFFHTSLGVNITSVGGYNWSNTSGDSTATRDTGLSRLAAGVVRVTNASTGAGSLVLGTSTVGGIGTSGVGVLAIANGTAPSSRPADEFQVYAADYAAGDSRANILSESNATPVTIGNHSVLTGYQHLTKTADYTVVIADSNVFFDNAGAGAGVVFTLPTPTASPSLKYTFCRVANQTMTVDIGGSVTIRSGANVTTSGGNITLDAVGTCLTIYSVSSTEWYASAQNGTLTFN